MLGAVSFDDQVMFKTSEVGDVSADRMLTPKVTPSSLLRSDHHSSASASVES